MNLSDKQRTLIIVGIGLLFILFGLAQALLGFEVDEGMVDQVSFILMMAAAALLFSGKRKRSKGAEEDESTQEQEEEK